MKITKIEVWNNPISRHTYLRRHYTNRHYTNPGMKHMVLLNPNEVGTSLVKDDIAQPFKAGIQHRVRP